ncbi:MarR family winged helix-turn-helix transcriptional regulator [Saccharopolyspora hordei]|mgnify:CR=1 FL=1|uniref:DNA-binding MarR family transcriptional regulator n=1 Tax=Saccharopolyspora hordei TaxID=1838 RepID=A0A853AHW7_9PSEU|nr:MarR family transcriptional regulator [Saccharopolyspora hordei]NYI81873.1 DNA-binding MarR family transcriptional regulator [Saccharopolyspora hordei]
MGAWRAYIVGSALLEHRLNRDLQLSHDLSIADYEILVRLSESPDQRMRMSELANDVAHSKSRTSHQVRRLEAAGLVRRVECPDDGRGVLAVLTEAGAAKLREAAPVHVASVRENLIDLLDEHEQEVLGRIFDRLTAHLGGIK